MSTGSFYVVVVLLGVALFFVYLALRAFLKFRAVRVVTCPETKQPAAVTVDAAHAAVSAAWDHTELRLAQCSRWPERANCGQECVMEIAAAPEDCLVRSILARWYDGKRCVYCDKPISLHQRAQQPALRDAEGRTFDFVAMPPERLIGQLDQFAPVCFDCHVAEQFRRQYPDRIVDTKYEKRI